MGGQLWDLLLFTRHRNNGFVWNGVNLSQFTVFYGEASAATSPTPPGNEFAINLINNPLENNTIYANGNLIQNGSVITFYANTNPTTNESGFYFTLGANSAGVGPIFNMHLASPFGFSVVGWGTSAGWNAGATPVQKYGLAADVWDGNYHKFVFTINDSGTEADLNIDGTDWGSVSLNGPLEGSYFGFIQPEGTDSVYIYDLSIVN